MKSYKFFFLFLFTAGFQQVFAQASISGTVADSTDNAVLIGASVILQKARDTTQWTGATTDVEGRFRFSSVEPGRYRMKFSYIGYTGRVIAVRVREALDLGEVRLYPDAVTLQGVEIKGAAIQVEQKGDTLQYNANAFKTNRDATAEDLLGKMPGITTDNTGVKAQGEQVQQVLVDGKQFFGDDAAIALKNLPAEVIDKIEVFDRLSEQSQFTGFDDGQTRKTINIVTKKGKNNGQFGRLYAGAGENGLYTAGGNINSFNGDRKLSLVGLSNNINQQNFSNEDLLGVTGSSARQGGRGGGGGGGGNRGGGGGSPFSVGQQSGISTTHSVGLNYSDNWGKKAEVTASYFFNQTDNERFTDLSRMYITQADSGLLYTELNRSNSRNYNHRLNARIEYTIDTLNSLVLTPRLSFQQNDASSLLQGDYTTAGEALQNTILNRNASGTEGYNFSNTIMFRHRFKVRRRSFAWAVNTEINNREGDSELHSFNNYESSGDTLVIDQRADQYTDSYTFSTNLTYTEPVGKQGQLQLNYSPSYTHNKTDKRTFNIDPESGAYTAADTLLTNIYDNTYVTQRGGASYRYNNKMYNANVGVNYQHAQLRGDQEFPFTFAVDRSFQSFLPQASLRYKAGQSRTLQVNYRTNTNAPSVSQLQNVIDNRNPLFLKTGNPTLAQDYTHTLSARYNLNNLTTSTTWLFLLSGSVVNDYITNATFIAPADTVFRGIELNQGTQLSYPVNMNGYANARALITYGTPVAPLKSNINVNTGMVYNRMPGLINGDHNLADNYTLSQGVVLSSNISEALDFTVSYSANYTIVRNSLQKQADNNYFNQVSSLRLNWLFAKGFVFTTNVNNNVYRGLSAEFDQSIWLWNAGLGYKFLKDQSLEIKINAFDILNNNQSITREITESYIEDRRTNVLTRYFMLTATYSLRNFR